MLFDFICASFASVGLAKILFRIPHRMVLGTEEYCCAKKKKQKLLEKLGRV
jgi:hypothetical protein